jgi:hypothetical protein
VKRYLIGAVYLGLWVACQSASAQTATEKAEKRLADLLAPGGGTAAVTFTTQPLAWKASPAVEDIAPRVKPFAGATVRFPQAPGKEVKPRAVPEGVPLVAYQDKSPPPKDVKLPTKPLIRLPSLDVHTPLPIPILAQQQKDRASLGDPALEASLSAALKRLTPARDRPVPFAPLNLPDPFEHVRTGQLRNPPDENPMPPVIPLRKPK